MKALVLEEYNKLVYKDVPEPEVKPGEVLVRIKACGICGSDVQGLDSSTGRRIPPIIMGHEASGVIASVGPGVSDWKTGDSCVVTGAGHAFNSSDADVPERIKALTGGRGADISFEAVGKTETVNLAVTSTRKGGTVVLVGNISKTIEFPLQKVVTSGIRVLGSCAIRGEYDAVLKLMKDGRLDVSDMISAVAPLSEGAEWFR